MNTREGLSQLDLCFVVDCTSSMTPFIHAAQRQLPKRKIVKD